VRFVAAFGTGNLRGNKMSASLKDFIAQTLREILDGVSEAQSHALGKNIAPWGIGGAKYAPESGIMAAPGGPMTIVRFDVAVTAETSDAVKGGGGFKVAVLSLGASSEAAEKSVAATRVQFSIPIVLPATDRIG
jgi:hypothetical protein